MQLRPFNPSNGTINERGDISVRCCRPDLDPTDPAHLATLNRIDPVGHKRNCGRTGPTAEIGQAVSAMNFVRTAAEPKRPFSKPKTKPTISNSKAAGPPDIHKKRDLQLLSHHRRTPRPARIQKPRRFLERHHKPLFVDHDTGEAVDSQCTERSSPAFTTRIIPPTGSKPSTQR